MDLSITLSDGTVVTGSSPVVVIGPNGSGKSREVRRFTSSDGAPVEVVNALRNTRVTNEIPASGLNSARTNLANHANQARSQPWELANDFDSLLGRLRAEDSAAAIAFRDATRRGQAPDPDPSAMERLQAIWAAVFPGRALTWNDNVPMVESKVPGNETSYQGQFMSDGEKAALYVAGKVLLAQPGILIIDEPDLHFHTLLAVELWNALEAARDDLRLIYVTHDLTFGLSRRDATFVLVAANRPLRLIAGLEELPPEAAVALLGAASFSFYAKRLVLCEGELNGPDHELYRSWFGAPGTVVRPIGSSEMVIRSVGVLTQSSLISGLDVLGIIDRDFNPAEMLDALPPGIIALSVHEVESLYCIPTVVSAVARHVGKPFDEAQYITRLRVSLSDIETRRVIVERWKRRVEANLLSLIGSVDIRSSDLDTLIADLPRVFDQSGWTFSPVSLIESERTAVETVVPSGSIVEILRLMPGKALISLASTVIGLSKNDYRRLVNTALSGGKAMESLGIELAGALGPYLPARS